jgi:cysteine synthase A
MKLRQTKKTVAEAAELPNIIQLQKNLFAAAFFLMKLIPARFILDRAEAEGVLRRGSTIIETTSGTFGLALAILSALRGYRLILVSDPAIDEPLKRRLEDIGTRVEIMQKPAEVGGFQRARLDRMAELQAEYPDHFWPSQYNNPHNPGGYSQLAELLVEAVGKIDCLVGTVGSGGSVCGTSSYLRLMFPHLHVIGVDTHGSVLFGQPDAKRMLRGLGNSLMPKNLDHTLFNEIHWVSAAEAFCETRALHRRKALFMGGTSGAAYMAARWWAERHPDANVVVLLPDEGYRYQSTVYDDNWLHANGLLLSQSSPEPRLVSHPSEAADRWSRIEWNRRSYERVMGAAFTAGGAR